MAEPGGCIGPYRVIRLLGAGASGQVFEAEDPELGRRVAIKLLRGGAQLGAPQLERFRREREALARLRHPHLLGVHSAGSWQGSPYVVTELLPGRTLRHLIAAGELGMQERIAQVRAIASGVAALHAAGLIHRDLKPENVLIDGAGQAKVADLGLVVESQDKEPLTRSGALIGTLAYMAPECLRGELIRAPAADVYSLGVMSFELLTGQLPHPAAELVGLLEERSRRPQRDPREVEPAVPAGVARVCWKAMAGDPARRFAHAGELLAALDGSSRPGPSPALIAVVGLLGLAAGVAGAERAVRDRQETPPTATTPLAPAAPVASSAPERSSWARAEASAEELCGELLSGRDGGARYALAKLESAPLFSWPAAGEVPEACALADGTVLRASGSALAWARPEGSSGGADALSPVEQLLAGPGGALAILSGGEPGLYRVDLAQRRVSPLADGWEGARAVARSGDLLAVALGARRVQVERDGAPRTERLLGRAGEQLVVLDAAASGAVAAILGSPDDPGALTSFVEWWTVGADELARLQLPTACALAFTPSGERLAVGTSDGRVLLFDDPGSPPRTLGIAGQTRVHCLVWGPTGRSLYVGLDDKDGAGAKRPGGTIAWDVERDELLRGFGEGRTWRLSLSPDGRILVRSRPQAVEVWTTAGDRVRLSRP